jgi:hypothetical protein
MNEKTLFEIPIYSMSEVDFNERWNKKKSDLLNEFMSNGHTEESAKSDIKTLINPRCIWKYNQIIGFIKILVTRQDVLFDVYCSMDKTYYADSKSKHFIVNLETNGTHFYIDDKPEEYIKQQIKEVLKIIEKNHLRPRFYVDYSTFNNIFEFVEIKQIMKTL